MRIPASEPLSRGDRIPSGRNAAPEGGTLLDAPLPGWRRRTSRLRSGSIIPPNAAPRDRHPVLISLINMNLFACPSDLCLDRPMQRDDRFLPPATRPRTRHRLPARRVRQRTAGARGRGLAGRPNLGAGSGTVATISVCLSLARTGPWQRYRRSRSAHPRAVSSRGNLPRPAPRQRAGPACGLVLLGDPALPAGSPRSRNELRYSPLTRIPLPSHAATAACPEDTCPASHSARRPSCAAPPGGTTSDRSSVTRETSRHGLLPSARPTESSSPRGLPRAAAQWPLRSRPRFARDRDVALSALAARRPLSRAIAARHIRHLPVPPQTPDVSSGDAPGGASDCGALYHAIITPASPACLADPLPPLAWRPI